MEWCIYCEGIYELDESTSSVPKALCSIECEKGFDEHQKQIQEWVNSLK